MKPRVLAVVPARAHSKRIPGKNKKPFLGKPLIHWSIEAALSSECVTDVIVTTDDEGILNFKNDYSKVHFVRRPEHLALDSTPGVDPILHLMTQLDKTYDYLVLLQPTSPLRTGAHIDQAFQVLLQSAKSQVVSVKKIADPIGHIVFKGEKGVKFLKNELKTTAGEQDLKVLNGAIYISKWKTLLDEKTFLGSSVEFFEMDEFVSVDIDYPSDWERAESFAGMKA